MELWDTATGQPVLAFRSGPGSDPPLAFRRDGRQLAVGHSDGGVTLWDAATGTMVDSLSGHIGRVNGLAYSPDGRRLASCGNDETVQIWDIGKGNTHRILAGHSSLVRAVAFNHDGSWVASAAQDNTVRIWDAATGKLIGVLRGHGGHVRSVAFSPDGRRIASGSDDGTIKLWDARESQPERTFPHDNWVPRAVFFPDGSTFASACWDNRIRVWDAATGQPIGVLHEMVRSNDMQEAGEIVHSLAISPDGRRIASTNRSGTVRLWDAATGRLLRSLQGHQPRKEAGENYPRRTLGVTFHPDGHQVAAAGWDGTVRTWDPETGQQLGLFRGPRGIAITAVYSPDGTRIAAAFTDGTVRVWNLAEGREIRQLPCASDGATSTVLVNMLAFRPDSRWLAMCSNPADGGPGEVRVFDALTGKPIFTLPGHTSQIVAVTFSPDGTRIATASLDLTVKLWETETGQEVCTLRGHTAGVLSVVFCPDGRKIATSSMDGTVRVWETAGETAAMKPR